ncbi:hypothetical protein DXG03_002750 [Asterophora parasitica]|uniref:DUF6589 domain-containing protein n=1 Tax=Asterophora parasitica TaxID=117018 RepID=A0A9P7G870_9AGAR|nr:hypothetical protein DXG03_002750 [Asterophora parasitica]
MATGRIDDSKATLDLARGPHMLRIDRATAANGSKKNSLLTLCNANPDHMHGFKKYADLPLFQFTPRRPLPEAYRTRTVPVATSSGPRYTPPRHLSLVQEIYLTKLDLTDGSFRNRAIPCINDSATNDSLRRVQEAATKDSKALENLDCLQSGLGLGDIMRKLVKHTLKSHCPPGSDEVQARRPRDRAKMVLTGGLLDCWRISRGFDSVDEYAASNPKPEDIFKLAKIRVVPKQPHRFKDDHEYSADNSDSEGSDMVYRNHRLLNRSLIYIMLLKHAIADARPD